MEKVRQDAWSHEDDLMLAETVLRHIREGGTQLQAFEEVARNLNRTSAACGFRWNAEIRQKYEQAIELAKKQRKERKRALASKMVTPKIDVPETQPVTNNFHHNRIEIPDDTTEEPPEITLDHVISFLQDMNNNESSSKQLQRENERLKRENNELKSENEILTNKINRLNERKKTIQEDYQALIQIMDRARQMVSPATYQTNDISNMEQMAE